MQLLDVTMTCLSQRNRAVFVDAGVDLVPGEKVVVRATDEYYAATVVDEVAEGRYLLNLGVRLPEEYAVKRLEGAAYRPSLDQVDDLQDLLDLIGEARALLDPAPLPRQRVAS